MSNEDVFKRMRNLECLVQGVYDEMIEVFVMLEKAEKRGKDFILSDLAQEGPDELFEGINDFLLKLKDVLLENGFECTDEEMVCFLIKRKLGKI